MCVLSALTHLCVLQLVKRRYSDFLDLHRMLTGARVIIITLLAHGPKNAHGERRIRRTAITQYNQIVAQYHSDSRTIHTIRILTHGSLRAGHELYDQLHKV